MTNKLFEQLLLSLRKNRHNYDKNMYFALTRRSNNEEYIKKCATYLLKTINCKYQSSSPISPYRDEQTNS